MKTKTLAFSVMIGFCNAHAQQSLDAYVTDSAQNVFTLVAGTSNLLLSPIDLDFYPDQDVRPNELWILNQGTYNSGGSTVIVSSANSSTRAHKYVKDGNAWHFMALASAIAFGDSNWATSNDILDANRQGGRYTGPTLWPGDLSIYGIVGNPATSQFNGSHLDMIHQSPYGKGIAFEKDNYYWVLDGYDGTLKRYNFGSDHGPGQEYHGDGGARVYPEFEFALHASLPGHLVIDSARKYLYGCDPSGKRVFRVDITTGAQSGSATKVNNEQLAGGYFNFTGITKDDSLITGLESPVGIDIYGKRLIVTDNFSDEIIIYNIEDNYSEVGRIKLDYTSSPDPMGVKVGPDGRIYFVDKMNMMAYMIENPLVLPLAIKPNISTRGVLDVFPNPASTEVRIQSDYIILNGRLTIVNVLGEHVLSQQLLNTNRVDINVGSLNSGIYFIQLIDNGVRQMQRFVKQ